MESGWVELLRNGPPLTAHMARSREVTERLELAAAGELASAWSAAIAQRLGVRILILKGASLARYGIRRPRVSGDVDVLVEPARFDEFCAALVSAGWSSRETPEIGAARTQHSSAFVNANWPCDIDVHRRFPGFLVSDSAAFEQLWESRSATHFGHFPASIPSRNASILVALLHQLRNGPSRLDQSEMNEISHVALSDADRADLVLLATHLGAVDPLRDVLQRLGVDEDELPAPIESAALRAWNARIHADGSGVYFWLQLIQRTPLGQRPAMIVRAIWPPRSELLADHPGIDDTVLARLGARILRLSKGIRGAPRAFRAFSGRTSL